MQDPNLRGAVPCPFFMCENSVIPFGLLDWHDSYFCYEKTEVFYFLVVSETQ